MLIETLRADGLLSFAPGSEEIALRPLNVMIGPNGSGKSNLIETIELLRAIPTGFAAAIRDGGGVREWLWKGDNGGTAAVDVRLARQAQTSLRYKIGFAASGARTEVVDEVLEEAEKNKPTAKDVHFYYRFQDGHPILNLHEAGSGKRKQRRLKRESLAADESVLSQRKDPELYPELAWCSNQFARIQTFREWGFGRMTPVRQPQPADLPTDVLLSDGSNLAMIIQDLEHQNALSTFEPYLKRFLPRFERLSTRVSGATIMLYLHERGVHAPIPAVRISDGTLRFIALLVVLLSPTPPPVVCIEEPELGIHPDALDLLAELLVEASSRSQIIVTTHADALVSALTEHPESVLVCEHFGDGTVMSRLEKEKLEFWLEKYQLGDIWRMGAIGGNP